MEGRTTEATSGSPASKLEAVGQALRLRAASLGWTEWALIAILAAAAALRLWLIHAWRPGFVGYPDASTYIDAARMTGLGSPFRNDYRPAGYPLFLIWLHAIHPRLTFVIIVQHLMGLATALLLYLAVARFTRRRWVALVPVVVIGFAGTQLYLEHSALSEALYTFLLAAAIWCAARAVDSELRGRALWLGAAGLLIGLSSPVRSTGVFIAPVLIAWAAVITRGRRPRLLSSVAVIVGFSLALGSYLVYQHSYTGTWGLTRTTGYTLYARAAIFANCSDFTPPAGTSGLCQPPGEQRYNPDWYMYNPGSPAAHVFGFAPDPRPGDYKWPPDSKLQSFAVTAISHQPLAYLWTTFQGLVKYVDPQFGTPNMLGWSQSKQIDGLHASPQEPVTDSGEVQAYYPGQGIVHHNISPLDSYAKAARVEGPVTAILVLLMIAGFVLARGRARVAAGLFGWTTVVSMLVPVLILFYETRYATPVYGPLAASAALGLDEVAERHALAGGFRSLLPARFGGRRRSVPRHASGA